MVFDQDTEQVVPAWYKSDYEAAFPRGKKRAWSLKSRLKLLPLVSNPAPDTTPGVARTMGRPDVLATARLRLTTIPAGPFGFLGKQVQKSKFHARSTYYKE